MNEKKISLTTAILLFIIFILIMAIVGGIVYFVNYKEENDKKVTGREYNNVINNDKPNTDTNTSLNFNINENLMSENNTSSNLHLFFNLTGESNYLNKSVSELVTDAKLSYKTGIDSFTYGLYNWSTQKEDKYTYEANSLKIGEADLETSKFPYVNIDSTYGREINNEVAELIKEYFDLYVDSIKLIRDTESIQDMNEKKQARWNLNDERIANNIVKYNAYKNDNILSIVIVEGPITNIGYKYKTFNIDLNTGKRVNLEEAYKKLGYTQSELEEDLLKEVSELVKERCEANDILDKHEGLMSYNEKRVVSTIENDNASYFIDENKNLNIVVMTNQPWGKDNHDILYTVKK